jgi:hypothetical protein
VTGPTAWPQVASAYNTSLTTLVTTTETVVCTLAGISSRGAGFPISLHGSATVVPGLSTTATTLRVRRGSVSGTLVAGAMSAHSFVSGSATEITLGIDVQDVLSGEISGATYVLTAQLTSATTLGSVTNAALTAVQ